MKTKAEIIQETIDHYKTHPRAISQVNGQCIYSSIENGILYECAVGRCLTDEAKQFDFFDSESDKSAQGIYDDILRKCNYDSEKAKIMYDEFFKEEYRGHEYDFWQCLQGMHDNDDFWEENHNTNTRDFTKKGKKWMMSRFPDEFPMLTL